MIYINADTGVVEQNEGTIEENQGVVDNCKGGVVTLNKGDVYNYGGTVITNEGSEYYTVDIAVNNGSVTRNSGFTDHNGRDNWARSGSGATVTLRPAKGYTIQKLKAPAGVTAKKNKDGSWTLTITDPSKLPAGGLVFSGSKKSAVRVQVSEDAFYKLNEKIAAAIRSAGENGTVKADMKQYTAVLRMVAEAMAERPDVRVTFIFKDGGRARTFTIPAGADAISAFGGEERIPLRTLAKKLNLKVTAKK